MKMSVLETEISDLLIIKGERIKDNRGFFKEVYRQDILYEVGLPLNFVQLNHSSSSRNVLRGLHFQYNPPMGKMMRVIRGEVFSVAVDLRKKSPTLGKWYGKILTENDDTLIYAPACFARGFCVLSDVAEMEYLCTGTYNNKGESGIVWNDSQIGIQWPITNPIISSKDNEAQTLSEWMKREESNLL